MPSPSVGGFGYVSLSRVLPQQHHQNPRRSYIAIYEAEELPIFTMSYSKRDEDAESGVVKVDRTSVFQEGR